MNPHNFLKCLGGGTDSAGRVSRFRDDTSKTFSDEVMKALRQLRRWGSLEFNDGGTPLIFLVQG